MAFGTRSSKPVVKRAAVFVRRQIDGKDNFVREPFDIVTLDWGNGEFPTYLQPRLRSAHSATEAESYDDLKVLDPQELNQWPRIGVVI